MDKHIERYLHRAARPRRLVVIIHGYTSSLGMMQPVTDAVRSAYPDADVFLPLLPYGNWYKLLTMADPARVSTDLVSWIDAIWADRREAYEELILVGYSAGSMIARKVAVLAHGTNGAAFEEAVACCATERVWAKHITRIVLLAGFARGWSPNSALDWLHSALWSGGAFVGDMFGGRAFILALRAGSPFMVQSRLQWLALARGGKAPLVVQLLGTIDDFVSPDDNVDLLLDEFGEKYVLLEVPGTGHKTVLEMSPTAEPSSFERRRWEIFTVALTAAPEAFALRPELVPAAHLSDSLPPPPDEEVTDVVFVIHGIRDRGFWTQKVAREIKRVAESAAGADRPGKVVSMTASYGYFPMAPFVLPWIRARKVGWLMDRYTEARARFPNARFSYVGHSNGSYLVAGALRDYPAAAFRHVVLAGSVVRTDFRWSAYLAADRLQGLMNYVATGDLVVAGFPKGFERLGLFDLGGGGHDGFADLAVRPAVPAANGEVRVGGKACYELRYVRGGHGAGVRETQWDEIANFVVHGRAPPERGTDFAPRRSRVFGWIFALQPLPLLALVAAVGVLLWGAYVLYWPLFVVLLVALLVVLNKF